MCYHATFYHAPSDLKFEGHIQPYVFTNLSWDNIDRLEATVTGAGKRFQDAGLGDLCVESGILAGGSVAGVFEGKAYKRGVRVHKCVLEALLRMIWQCFLPWVKDNHPDKLEAVNQLQDLVVNFHDDVGQAAFESLLQQSVVTYVLHLWNDFLNYLRHDNGELSAFWMTYVDIIQDILLGLLRAPPSQPEIYKAFKDGNFSVQFTESNPFGRIPVDQTTEVTVNRDTQTVGGTTKFSLKPGAVSKYYLTAEYRSAFLTKLRNMVQHNRRGTDHPDLQKSRLQKDEELVTSVEETLANWANPFKCNTDLMNIAIGTVASKEIAEDLKNAHTKGETDYATFKRERLESDEPTKKFHDPMKQASLKTFGSAAKKRKTKYSDGRLDIVFDTYKPLSIKYNERANRATTGLQVQIVAPGQKIKQWHKFLALESNKISLIRFLVQEWRNEKYLVKLGHLHKVLFVTCEEQCFRFSAVRCREVPELQCVQEEADGRLLLHASHAAEAGYEAVMISSNDTDVLVLNIAFCGAIKAPLYQRSGTSTRTQLIDIGKVASSLGPSVCTALLGLHAYTGCDSVSSFAGKGKVAALKMLKSNENVQQAFSDLGKDWELSGEFFEKLEQFTCKLYAPKQPTTGVNELRYQLFCAKNGDIESHQLPPCQDCLWKHAQRANYQAGLWRRCLENDPQAPDPVGSGWTVERVDGKDILAIDWMNVQPAPDAVLELLACSCRKECTTEVCVCLMNGLKCTDMCKLQTCDNQPPIDDTADTAATLADENDDDDDDEDDI
ncbi:hypothetical protein ACOMHN_016084 [Nucella lapillus]